MWHGKAMFQPESVGTCICKAHASIAVHDATRNRWAEMHVSIAEVRADGDHDDRRTSAYSVDTSYLGASIENDGTPQDILPSLPVPGSP